MALNALVIIAVGLVLAFAGKRFVWLMVGGAGFILAYRVISWLIPGQSLGELIVAVGAGLILGWLATKFTKLLLMVAAFILVGDLALVVMSWFGITDLSLLGILGFAIGGFIGIGLLRLGGGLGLAIITAIGGAALVAYGLPMLFNTQSGWLSGLIGLVVAVAGVLFQQGVVGQKQPATPAPR